MRKTKFALYACSLIGFFVVLTFQACDPGMQTKMITQSSKLVVSDPLPEPEVDPAFFQYPFQSKPEFYADLQLFRPSGQSGALSEFTFLGVARYISNLAAPVSYTVRVRTPTGALICPTQTGTLTDGKTKISFSCVSAVQSTVVEVRMELKSGTAEYVVEKKY